MRMPFAPLGDPSLHFWMTRSLARSMGVNLSEAMAHGFLTRQAYADMITRCRTCPYAVECVARLTQPQEGVLDVPEECLNMEELSRLAAKLS